MQKPIFHTKRVVTTALVALGMFCASPAVAQNELSMEILNEKMRDIGEVSASVEQLVTANTGCMLQLRAGMERSKVNLPVRHVVEVLDESY